MKGEKFFPGSKRRTIGFAEYVLKSFTLVGRNVISFTVGFWLEANTAMKENESCVFRSCDCLGH